MIKKKNKIEPKVIYECSHFIVFSKPSGWMSQGGSFAAKKDQHKLDLSPNVVDWLRVRWQRPYVGLIHRLDRETSGLMLVAQRSKAAERLSRDLRSGLVKRKYQAWVVGHFPDTAPNEGQDWRHWLRKDSNNNRNKICSPPAEGAPFVDSSGRGTSLGPLKEARLRAQLIRRGVWSSLEISLLEFELETGRSHQIRAQAQAQGFPILGDQKYGPREPISPAYPTLALHSVYLEFRHPVSHEPHIFEDKIPF